jgi:uncharacterized protein involved in outer membrane biogenesis
MTNKNSKKRFSLFRVVRNLIILLISLIIGVYLLIIFATGPIIKPLVAKYVSPILGVPVNIEKIGISPTLNSITIQGVSIGSPKGFKAKNSFTLKQFTTSVNLASLLSKTIIVNEIIIDGADITYEHNMQTLSKNNFTRINRNIQFYLGAVDKNGNTIVPANAPEIKESTTAETNQVENLAKQPSSLEKIIIKKFRFINSQLRVTSTVHTALSVPTPIMEVKMDNIIIPLNNKITKGQALYKAGEKIFIGSSSLIGSLDFKKLSKSLTKEAIKNIGIIGKDASKTGSTIYNDGKKSLNSISNDAKEIKKSFKSLKGLFKNQKDDKK